MRSANSGPLSNWAWGGPADLTLEWASKVPSREGLQASRVGLYIFETKPINNRQKHSLPPLFRGLVLTFRNPGLISQGSVTDPSLAYPGSPGCPSTRPSSSPPSCSVDGSLFLEGLALLMGH